LTPPPQIRTLLSHATGQYAAGDLQGAKDTVKEIIRLDGQSSQGYTLLSHIHEDMGNSKEAANALYMAAANAARDSAAWIRAARMARDIGFDQQALKCFDEYAPR
jgi:Tfp pilus assembly protein PilF